ncbi:hypothetical protein [Roseateles sp. BYS96W]|uniref:Transmembrane protein n=1 Tax=Pelomonas nitida TaxID=3299027 RepID=A0ABW7G9X7_9BURK
MAQQTPQLAVPVEYAAVERSDRVMRTPISRIERIIVALALLVLLLTVITSSGMLPQRSFTSLLAGFAMLGASGAEVVCLCWLIARKVSSGNPSGRKIGVAVLAGIAGAAPAVVTVVRLLVEAYF